MGSLFNKMNIIDVTVENVDEVGIYCIKNKKAPGYNKKIQWFKEKINKGLKIKIVTDESGKQNGFIEYLPSEVAWRPIKATNYFFIQCIAVFGKAFRNHKIGASLLKQCEDEAREQGKYGVCTMTSNGSWIATKELFSKNGFETSQQLGRFELMYKSFDKKNAIPVFNDWKIQQKKYIGWNIVYSDQCPWHEKSVNDLKESAKKHGVKLKVKHLNTPQEAQNAPSGFGTYTLIKDGKVLEDHYISKTRFENIIKQELQQ